MRALRWTHHLALRAAAPGAALASFASHAESPTSFCSEDLAAENQRLREELERLRHDARLVSSPPSYELQQAPVTSAPRRLAKGHLGTHVCVWGQRDAIPVSDASGDREPDSDIRAPAEIRWFHMHAERHGRLWEQITFGPSFGVARTDHGELFVWGSCRLGSSRKFVSPRLLPTDGTSPDCSIQDAQCSESAIWALTSSGEVLVWERVPEMMTEACGSRARPLRPPRILGGLSRPVRQMSIGPTHASFTLDNGDLYCIGCNRNGECATDPSRSPMAVVCQKVQFPAGVTPIVQARCGRSHTSAISSNGSNFAWGDDSKIQLGLGDTRSNFGDERPYSGSRGFLNQLRSGEAMAPSPAMRGAADSPSFSKAHSSASARYSEFEPHYQFKPSDMQSVPLEFERQVHGISYPPADGVECGDDFTILIIRDSPDWFAPEEETNRLFCCGDNSKGQCGRSMQAHQQTFAATRTPRNSRTESLACGSSHCLAVLKRLAAGSEKPELWSWGSNERGQAGVAQQKGVVCPAARIKLPDRGLRIEAACCGFSNSAVICSEKKSYVSPEEKTRRRKEEREAEKEADSD